MFILTSCFIERIDMNNFSIEDLSVEERRVVLAIIRSLIPKYHYLQELNYGFEKTEEEIIYLLEQGLLAIIYNEDNESFTFGVYDEDTGDYITAGDLE